MKLKYPDSVLNNKMGEDASIYSNFMTFLTVK